MGNRKIRLFTALAIVVFTILLLVTGSPLLTVALDRSDSIPLGTFITWAGLIALPLTVYYGVQELRAPTTRVNKILSLSLKSVLLLAFLWVPLSYALAGNLSFSFSEKVTFQGGQTAMKWFWRLSYTVAIVPILVLLVYWVSALFSRLMSTEEH